jgi:molybdate transport system ATP-binding protein
VGRAEVRESGAHREQEITVMPESSRLASSSAPRLVIDIERQLPEFRLAVRLQVGTEICVLFGPSGVGKTTTLNSIAGLLAPDAGEITLDGRPLYRRGRPGAACNVPARHRKIGYVFQGYALFPHLTALENVAYPLRRQRDARYAAAALLERMHLAHLVDRYPAELSGGQQQRVAVARALAADPQVLLLDEPFSALDAGVREKLQRDLAALQAELHLVVLYVTHQLEDAFAMGHTLAVLGEGRVVQVGPIEEVFRRPVNAGVAEIMGMRNLFRAKVISAGPEGLTLDWDGLRLEAPPQAAIADAILTSYIRPEEIKVLYPDRPLTGAVAHNQVTGRVVESRPSTSYHRLRVALANGHDLEVRFPRHAYAGLSLGEGETVRLSLRREALVGLEKTQG